MCKHEKGETVLTPCSFTNSSCKAYRINGWTDLSLPWSAHHCIGAPPKSSGDQPIWGTAGETCWCLCTLWASLWGSLDTRADVQSVGQTQHVHHEVPNSTFFHTLIPCLLPFLHICIFSVSEDFVVLPVPVALSFFIPTLCQIYKEALSWQDEFSPHIPGDSAEGQRSQPWRQPDHLKDPLRPSARVVRWCVSVSE